MAEHALNKAVELTTELTAEQLITENLDIWTTAIEQKSASGRGSSKKFSLHGIKKLRELILELAVRGKLVPQASREARNSASYEPASILLERIASEKAQLVKDKKIKKPKALPVISEDEKPFELPKGWEWTRLQDIGHDLGQKTPDCEFTYIDVGAINKELGFVEEPSILKASDAPSRARKLVKRNTVIYSTVRPYLLNIAVIGNDLSPEPIASTAFAIIHPLLGMNSSYIYRYLRSPCFINYVESVQTGIAYPAINDKQFFNGIIAIPPTEEQHRIVAKVDELMILCDALEAQTEASKSAHQTLVEILLGALLLPSADANSPEPVESPELYFIESWQRVAEHFDTLFTTSASIDTLKQTILQLAVMGKLVPQDTNDEPAAKLLERIAAEKAQLIADKKIKKQKPLPAITDEEKPFELPNGWEWARFVDIAYLITDGAHHTPKYIEHGIPFLSVKDMSDGKLNFGDTRFISEEQHKDLIKRCNPQKGDLLLTKIGTTGVPVLINTDKEFSIFVSVALIKFSTNEIDGNFLSLLVKSPLVKKQSQEGTQGVGNKNLVLKTISNFPLLFPPLNEQHRIVAKVDELMALCDQLKARLSDAQTIQLHLTDAIVEQAI
ncbi:restriction endonuclease subunit S [Shewanella woodyi]|uniref:Restriction modification system DNA specificity domain n=1 Tax=Shewanella woodyi (strain ATCC 51908 / MS32) TaxID=392500 RepID=B1KQE3_SHEWM|nr:restriction endonuclease subunit S [Shewanella woodyi]ACA84798.1 restriction modification system DNA specificity domain [Shewanella woodyi ATCC 51908]